MYLTYLFNEGAENKRYNAMECKQVRHQAEPLPPLAQKHREAKITKGGYYSCF